MKRKNQNRTFYPYKRRESLASYRRPTPSPSYRRPTPSPSYRKSTPSPSYRKSTLPSYKNTQPRINTKQKIGISAFSIIFTTLGLFGAFYILNPTSTSISTPTPINPEKIAVFFWASDIYIDQSTIDDYIRVLEDEGYSKFFDFEDTDDFERDFQIVADDEDNDDIVFFYLIGHGNNNGQNSYSHFAPGSSRVYSNDFREMCDKLDSSKVGLLVESCFSGDWVDDMVGGGYLSLSAADENNYCWLENGEGIFSRAFFDEIESGSNAIEAFSVAENVVDYQHPKLCDESAHDFFE